MVVGGQDNLPVRQFWLGQPLGWGECQPKSIPFLTTNCAKLAYLEGNSKHSS